MAQVEGNLSPVTAEDLEACRSHLAELRTAFGERNYEMIQQQGPELLLRIQSLTSHAEITDKRTLE